MHMASEPFVAKTIGRLLRSWWIPTTSEDQMAEQQQHIYKVNYIHMTPWLISYSSRYRLQQAHRLKPGKLIPWINSYVRIFLLHFFGHHTHRSVTDHIYIYGYNCFFIPTYLFNLSSKEFWETCYSCVYTVKVYANYI